MVKVDKLVFPVDFVVLDVENNKSIPLILGKPFLATGRTMMDIVKGEIVMQINNISHTFDLHKVMKYPLDKENTCLMDDSVENFYAKQVNKGNWTNHSKDCGKEGIK
ncbi:UNVERIFIED_CONTAM: hypothetical protein ITH36_24875, partial [Salmonella enterica subsp. enterica serovar Weltevreden]